ncbi:MAG: hypothetical protein QF578_17205 [Alphaproteobacteria bacterium]|jgi:hypothetical protein|nr:hypothetical protein [Alphaproteobacteria bacterium]MDP6566568.1 hypothetical protein [Alphaproteobacteria bacterium]MDP6813650.1 hypothetical protein [Alphaproteobacteria bacterium]
MKWIFVVAIFAVLIPLGQEHFGAIGVVAAIGIAGIVALFILRGAKYKRGSSSSSG